LRQRRENLPAKSQLFGNGRTDDETTGNQKVEWIVARLHDRLLDEAGRAEIKSEHQSQDGEHEEHHHGKSQDDGTPAHDTHGWIMQRQNIFRAGAALARQYPGEIGGQEPGWEDRQQRATLQSGKEIVGIAGPECRDAGGEQRLEYHLIGDQQNGENADGRR
jgi:hypothetical protein